jgi:HD-GYP domain-containing protein (c-di-GMP phosphodiesterase class II)
MGALRFQAQSVSARLEALHGRVRADCPAIERMAVALYDRETSSLRTFAHSTVGGPPLRQFEMELAELPCLTSLKERAASRVIDDLARWPGRQRHHTDCLLRKGYRSSLTTPLYDEGDFLGFLFYDAPVPSTFTPSVTHRLEVYTDLATAIVASALGRIRVLRAAVRATRRIGRLRDPETGAHLERMSRYARIIALGIARAEQRDDEWIAFLTLFAPLHDVGKIGVPDRVLLKRGPLDPDEFRLMQTHVEAGRAIVDMLAEEFEVTNLPHVAMLRNVVLCHHEAADGTGYPRGLSATAIPLEARIVRVADVFDALTSDRPYKRAWPEEEAFVFLSERAAAKFDEGCVAALAGARAEVGEIRRRFAEEASGANTHEGYAIDI